MPAQVIHALRIAQLTVLGRRVVEGRAVFGDVDRRVAVASLDPQQDLREARGVDLPVHGGMRPIVLAHAGGPYRPVPGIITNDAARIIVHAEEIHRAGETGEIRGRVARPVRAEDVRQFRRIDAVKQRIQVPAVDEGVAPRRCGQIFRGRRSPDAAVPGSPPARCDDGRRRGMPILRRRGRATGRGRRAAFRTGCDAPGHARPADGPPRRPPTARSASASAARGHRARRTSIRA